MAHVVAVCELYGWDYYQYYQQPKLFLEYIEVKMNAEAIVQKRKDKERERNLSRNRMSGGR